MADDFNLALSYTLLEYRKEKKKSCFHIHNENKFVAPKRESPIVKFNAPVIIAYWTIPGMQNAARFVCPLPARYGCLQN